MRWKTLLVVSSALVALGVGCNDSTAPAPIVYTATLNAANELRTPPVNSTATGMATFTLSGDTLTYVITATGLTSNVIASHIHVGSPTTVSGSVVNGFSPVNAITSGTVASGSFLLSTRVVSNTQISGDSLRTLLNNGNAYVNVHTSTYTGGEIRGPIVRQ
jgi:hypothetical protein